MGREPWYGTLTVAYEAPGRLGRGGPGDNVDPRAWLADWQAAGTGIT